MITNTSRPQWLHNGTAAALTALAVSASFATSEPAATDSVRDPAPAKKLSLPEGQAELVFPENVAEVPSVFQSIGKQPMVQDMHITNAELIKTYDAALPPMRTSNFRRAPGDPEPPKMDLAGAYSAHPLQGNFPPIMLFGPYEEVTPGDYLVVYRFQILEVPEGKASLFFDVAHNACTTGGVRIPASSFEVGKWAEVAVPVTVPVNKTLEFRFWHGGAKAAIDRIYLFQVKLSEKAPDGEVPAGLPVDGREDVLRSPFGNESGMIDVVGFPAGSRIRCPYSGKFFRIP